nr:nuclear pore complex protein NUP133 [Ipomoea batatas]
MRLREATSKQIEERQSDQPMDIDKVGERAHQKTVLLMDMDNVEVFYSKVSDLVEFSHCIVVLIFALHAGKSNSWWWKLPCRLRFTNFKMGTSNYGVVVLRFNRGSAHMGEALPLNFLIISAIIRIAGITMQFILKLKALGLKRYSFAPFNMRCSPTPISTSPPPKESNVLQFTEYLRDYRSTEPTRYQTYCTEFKKQRQNIGAKPHALAFITVNGLGNILDENTPGDSDVSHLIIVDDYQPRVLVHGRIPLTVLEPQVVYHVVPQPNRLYRSFGRGSQPERRLFAAASHHRNTRIKIQFSPRKLTILESLHLCDE